MTCAIETKNLSKTFNRNIKALDKINLKIKKGGITALVGADSAGKTTLLRSITGFILPDEGTITTLELNPCTQREKINQTLGYMPKKYGLYEN